MWTAGPAHPPFHHDAEKQRERPLVVIGGCHGNSVVIVVMEPSFYKNFGKNWMGFHNAKIQLFNQQQILIAKYVIVMSFFRLFYSFNKVIF